MPGPVLRSVASADDRAAEALAALADDLVSLRPRQTREIRAGIRSAVETLRRHSAHGVAAEIVPHTARPGAPRAWEDLLQSEHRRFLDSADQMEWFLSCVEEEDHGGNRQALGQYARLASEAFRRHLADEGPSGPC